MKPRLVFAIVAIGSVALLASSLAYATEGGVAVPAEYPIIVVRNMDKGVRTLIGDWRHREILATVSNELILNSVFNDGGGVYIPEDIRTWESAPIRVRSRAFSLPVHDSAVSTVAELRVSLVEADTLASELPEMKIMATLALTMLDHVTRANLVTDTASLNFSLNRFTGIEHFDGPDSVSARCYVTRGLMVSGTLNHVLVEQLLAFARGTFLEWVWRNSKSYRVKGKPGVFPR